MQVFPIFLSVLLFAGACAKGDPVVRAKAAFDAGDFKTALVLAQPAAQAGDPKAQVILGLLFADGKGVDADAATAVAWFRRAAEQGYASGQYDMGMMTEAGEGVAEDPVEAYKWYALAAAQGDSPAAEKVKELEGTLKKRQVAEGKKRAAAFSATVKR